MNLRVLKKYVASPRAGMPRIFAEPSYEIGGFEKLVAWASSPMSFRGKTDMGETPRLLF
jgi:hypothetical protein